MIIMLEGVDGSGKSTLKNAIVKRLEELKGIKKVCIHPDGEKFIPTHPAKLGRLTSEALVAQLVEMARSSSDIFVCDRGPISDIIYRTFDKYDPLLDLNTLLSVYAKNITGFALIFCDTKSSEVLMLDRGEDNPVAIQRHQELRYLYKQVMSLFNHYHYDLDVQKDIDDTVNKILSRVWVLLETNNQPQYTIRTIKKDEVQ